MRDRHAAVFVLLETRPPNLWGALAAGLLAAAAVAAFVAYFSTRLRDIYFAITTLIFSLRLTPMILHWFVLAIVVLSYLLLRRITQSPFGMVLQSIRENEARTRAIGYPVERYKIVAVMLSGLFAGLAGVLYALQNQFAAPNFAFFLLLREGLSRFFTEYYLIPVGLMFIAMVIFMPQGLLGFARRWLNR